MRWITDLAYVLAGLAYLPMALYNAVVLGKNRRGWRQRFGFLSPEIRRGLGPHDKGGRFWLHGVSLGEINATPKLSALLSQRVADWDLVVSSTTDTGFARAVQLYGSDRVFRFPLDFSFVVDRVFRDVRPTMLILVELEVWPNLIRAAARRGIPVVVVNGRLTERSARRFAWLGRSGRSMFAGLTWVGAQDERIARRFRRLGVPEERVDITSSLKWDTAHVADRIEGDSELARALGLDGSRPLWVCGSTGPGEEEIVLNAYRRLATPLNLCIVPRKPERFDEVANLIARAGLACVRRSQTPDGSSGLALPHRTVILGDSMGELRKFYALADVVFVGRSLVPLGGSDPMEAAALGKALMAGPYQDNFQEPFDCLRDSDALCTASNGTELAESIQRLLGDPELLRSFGNRAREVVLRNQGATQQTVDRLVQLAIDNCGLGA